MALEFLKRVYDRQYKLLLAGSLLLLALMIGVLIFNYASTGEFVNKGVSLKGGLTVTIPAQNVDTHSLETFLKDRFPSSDVSVRATGEAGRSTGIIIEATDVESGPLLDAVSGRLSFDRESIAIENIGSSLGESFFRQTLIALVVAFISMAAVVFLTFRSGLPSLFVILAAVSDMVSTLAVISLLDVRLSTAGIAAFLMLIGYSVDTDILLTTRVLKRREGSILDRTFNAMKTGLLMTGTALVATVIGLFFTQSDVIRQIMLILTIGLLFDVIYTWIQNAGILRLYLEKKHGNVQASTH